MKRWLAMLLIASAANAGTLQVQITPRDPYAVTRLSYLLSHFAVDGVELPEQYAWLDTGQQRDTFTLHGVPEKFHSLRFVIGVDTTNDPASFPPDHPLNPNLNGLHWSWQGGYIALAIEGRHGDDGYAFHLARNTTTIMLPVTGDCRIEFDLGKLLQGIDRTGSTHSRDGDTVAEKLRANLPAAFQVVGAVSPARPSDESRPGGRSYLPAKYTAFKFTFSGKFPMPALPRDNPLLEERVALGQKLFHESLLSRNNSISCATCHDVAHAFADPRRYSLGVDGLPGKFNALPLFNLAWKSRFFWDGRAPSLREQVKFPIQDHVEMDENLTNVCAKLAGKYDFSLAFDNAEITSEKIGLALENFLLTLTSYHSKMDRGELTPLEQRGFELFFTEYDLRTRQYGADCFHCHGGALFTDNQIHDNGVGKFMTPSLRNLTKTGPYMHDGRFATLEEVVEHYSTGMKRSATLDPNLAKQPDGGVPLSADDKRALVAFLKALSDE